MRDSSISDEWVREHVGFVRALSRSILHAELREDAGQEAWLFALRSPPERNPRAWLRSVATRVAGRLQREGARRSQRERAVARPEALPSAASVAEKAEILRLVGEVVAELREPYREALMLRYYEGLAPRHIAARLDLPVATVHSRIQRGLGHVRAELERRGRGYARSWEETLALAVGLHPAPPGTTSGTYLTVGVLSMIRIA